MDTDINTPAPEPAVSLPARKVDIAVDLTTISSERKKEFALVDDLDDDYDRDEVGNIPVSNSYRLCEEGVRGIGCAGVRQMERASTLAGDVVSVVQVEVKPGNQRAKRICCELRS